MHLISITGHGNGSGKTSLIAHVGRTWPGAAAAVKFTTVFREGRFCPRDVQARCACTRLHDEVEVIDDEQVLSQPSTDTARMVESSLSPVLWCLVQPGHHAEGWRQLRERLPEDGRVLVEGNAAAALLPCAGRVFLVNPCVPRAAWKHDWQDLAERADVVVVNEAPVALGRRRVAKEDERRTSLDEVRARARRAAFVEARFGEDLTRWDAALTAVLAPPTARRTGTS